ncbi:MAG: MATE family efflux transporter [Ruminococcaceae bacterium]|nr:MATE family efflux transporter [Oscillospiraceae bacterium]
MQKSFWRTALMLALPIAFQNLLTSCASIIDTAMIVPIGNTAVAAVGVAGRLTFMLNVMSFGFSSGAATLISQYWGSGDKAGIRRTYGFAFTFSMIVAALYTAILQLFPGTAVAIFGPEEDVAALAVEYLRIVSAAFPLMMFSLVGSAAIRAAEAVSVPLVASILGVVTNTSLNFCLIGGNFGFPALGVRGAAIATFASAVVQTLVVLYAITLGKNPLRAHPREYFAFSKALARKFIKTAAPVFFNETMWAVGTNIYAMVYVRQSTEDYTGYTLFSNVEQLFFVFFVGICHATAIMVGKEVGRGGRDTAFRTAKKFLILAICMGLVVGGAMILLRNPLLSLFDIETQGAFDTASELLLAYGIILPLILLPYMTICGIFRAGGDTRAGFVFDAISMYGFGIPTVCLAGLVLHLPFVWIYVVMTLAENIIKTTLCMRHFFSKKWIIRLTD